MKLLKRLLLVLLVLGVAGAGYYGWVNRAIPDFDRKVLLFSKTTAYRHDAIATGIKTLTELGRAEQFNVVATEDGAHFSDESLSQYQAVVFLNTTGDVLNAEQQVAFERYIQAGGGFVGVHSAADTEWRENPWFWYQRLVGGVFQSHPSNSDQAATLSLVGEHSSTASLPATWSASDEWYDYQRVSKDVNVLMTVDESSYEGGQMGDDHPVAWYRDFDGGRSFYVGLGHTESTYISAHFLALLQGGLDYAMGQGVELAYAKSRPEAWRYTRVVLDSGLDEPLKLAFSPAGELYYIQRRGALRKYDVKRQTSVTVAELEVFTDQEYGLVGLAFDPGFSTNHWLYLFRTLPHGSTGRNVLSRFKFIDDELKLDTEEELLSIPVDGNATLRAAHTGGDMQFDREGNLWLSTGDDTNPGDQSLIDDRPDQQFRDAARSAGNTMDLRGKILRFTPQEAGGYSIPEGNLFADSSEGRPEIYTMGLRNPYTIAYDDRTGFLYWGDIGPDGKAHVDRGSWGFDEVNRTATPGNFGWPYAIGDNRPYAYYDYDTEESLDIADIKGPENRSRNNTGAKILPPTRSAWMYYPYEESDTFWELGTGGRNALVAPLFYSEDYVDSEVKFPSFMDGKLIISDFVRRWIKIVSTDESGAVETITPLIDSALSAPLDMAFGPDGALYVVEYGSNWFIANEDSYISRIEFYSGDNPPPVAIATASKMVGASPLVTVLDASASFDRGAGSVELSYRWQLVENGKPGTLLGTLVQQPITLENVGEQYVELTVSDVQGSESATRLRFEVGNERPVVNVQVTGNRSFFFDEGGLDYVVTVSDLEDGSTASGEIQPEDVTVVFEYIGQSEDLAMVLSSRTSDSVLEGRAMVTKGSDCHSCHAIDSESVGPSFSAVAQRYSEREDVAEYLANAVSKGSGGQWDGGHAMPGHPDLTEPQLQNIVAFILSLGEGASASAAGMDLAGSVVYDRHQKDYIEAIIDQVVTVNLGRFYPGYYLLHAGYTDKGTEGAASLQGVDTLLLRHAKATPAAFDEEVGVMSFNVGDGVILGLYRYPGDVLPEIYGVMKNIDLTGIRTIRVTAAALRPMMGGGPLELRLGAADSQPVASVDIEASFTSNLDESGYDLDVSKFDGIHDLVFSTSASDNSGQLAFSLLSMEFIR
ncbi:MAG: cytochrome c [Halioglobus sp.]|jgi:cytochrome c